MKSLFVVFFSLISASSVAEQLTLEYNSFYSHVRKLNDDDTSALQFAFGFKHIHEQRLCNISEGVIQTQKQNIPIEISQEQRFLVPSEKALKLAKAVIVLNIHDPANLCDMSVQLETKPRYLKSKYIADELQTVYSNYQAFFSSIGGLFSFMMPEPKGLRFEFAEVLKTTGLEEFIIDGNTLLISEEQLEQTKELVLLSSPKRITAWMDK